MKDFNIHKWYESKQNADVVYQFIGEINSKHTAFILEEVELCVKQLKPEPKILKKIANIVIELIQNIYHHSMQGCCSKCHNLGALLISYENGDYIIQTGNFVNNKEVEKIEQHINKINSLDAKELKELYRENIKNGLFSSKGGGGLGFIDIARKSKQKIHFQFHKNTEECSFFILKVQITHNKN